MSSPGHHQPLSQYLYYIWDILKSVHSVQLVYFDMYMSHSWVSFWWKVTSQRNAEWRHSVRRPCDTMRIWRRAYRNTIMLIRSSVWYGTMYRVASICFCMSQRCTSHRTMYMTYYTTYTWIRNDSVKAEYDFFSSRWQHCALLWFPFDQCMHFVHWCEPKMLCKMTLQHLWLSAIYRLVPSVMSTHDALRCSYTKRQV
jgi:hypothetical protein